MLAVFERACGRHWLEVANPAHRETFMLGDNYQMWHALALLASCRTAESEE
ncbi:MAG TPA: DUF423 domain-containing protein [Rhodospirillales bacterium]|nr:DUF423 domain-containing protein [Rhodospirillales bacterium]